MILWKYYGYNMDIVIKQQRHFIHSIDHVQPGLAEQCHHLVWRVRTTPPAPHGR